MMQQIIHGDAGKLYFALIFLIHSNVQTHQYHINKGPYTHTSYKFII
jgi:hypothetical protein